MASAILLGATVVRLLLVPAVMHMLGRFTWWMPRGLRRLPESHIEGRPELHLRRHIEDQPPNARVVLGGAKFG